MHIAPNRLEKLITQPIEFEKNYLNLFNFDIEKLLIQTERTHIIILHTIRVDGYISFSSSSIRCCAGLFVICTQSFWFLFFSFLCWRFARMREPIRCVDVSVNFILFLTNTHARIHTQYTSVYVSLCICIFGNVSLRFLALFVSCIHFLSSMLNRILVLVFRFPSVASVRNWRVCVQRRHTTKRGGKNERDRKRFSSFSTRYVCINDDNSVIFMSMEEVNTQQIKKCHTHAWTHKYARIASAMAKNTSAIDWNIHFWYLYDAWAWE